MGIDERIADFEILGQFLGQFGVNSNKKQDNLPFNQEVFEKFDEAINSSIHYNGWFTRENIVFSLQQWHNALKRKNLQSWLQAYDLENSGGKKVGIVMAGNIPLVGFHDFISVLLTGHSVLVKLSSQDKLMLPLIAQYLILLNPAYKDKIEFTENQLQDFDAVIATGSDNTARYFEYYFGNKPNIIRKNRNSVAVLSGNESHEDLKALGEDIFRYYGLGCRNVSKLYVPQGYDFDAFFKAIYEWRDIIQQNKYANNYDYNKAVYLMSEFKLLENSFLILKEDQNFASPIGGLFYEFYSDEKELGQKLKDNRDKLQCIVGKDKNQIPFGKTQQPKLWDYADGVDPIAFLQQL
ncbi:acyl-CoA reductase [Salegentibacter sp. HM20]